MVHYNLKRIRKASGETCEDMARIIGLKTKGGYNKKENGHIPFTLAEAKKASDHFGLSIEAIFFENKVSKIETLSTKRRDQDE